MRQMPLLIALKAAEEALAATTPANPTDQPPEPLRALTNHERPMAYRCVGDCYCEGMCRLNAAWKELTEMKRREVLSATLQAKERK